MVTSSSLSYLVAGFDYVTEVSHLPSSLHHDAALTVTLLAILCADGHGADEDDQRAFPDIYVDVDLSVRSSFLLHLSFRTLI